MRPISMQERAYELYGDQPAWRIRRADLTHDDRRLVRTIALRLLASRYGLLRYVWHPALFVFAVYIVVLSSWVLLVARRSS
jgi:hypothetical protein